MSQKYILENEFMKVTLSSHGAELRSLIKKDDNVEYMWQADAAFWGRTSPVLFPIVGSLAKGCYVHEDITYPMGQHGFARDMEFALKSQTTDEIWFTLSSNDETLAKYPFAFTLEIGYHLDGNQLTVLWNVINQDTKTMYYSIGAHPAFNCPLGDTRLQSEYQVSVIGTKDSLTYHLLNEAGLRASQSYVLSLDSKKQFAITPHMFNQDALIFEGNQLDSMSLSTPEGKNYVTVRCETAKLFGLWSPAGKNAPFVCIEPWFGRCDGEDFHGELRNREHGNILEAGKSQEYHYCIEIN